MKTLDLTQAAEFLKMRPNVLRQKAAAGIIQGAKPGKCWCFLEEDLVAYIRSLYKQKAECPSISGVRFGGRASLRPVGDEYKRLVGLPSGSKPRNTTTS